jgi:Flp pilus assembly protein TadD
MRGPRLPRGRVVEAPVSLVDVASTVLPLLGVKSFDGDGVSLVDALDRRGSDSRVLYAESFAPLLDFGWSPLRAVREGDWKMIAAPRPELYDLAADPVEMRNVHDLEPQRAGRLQSRVDAFSGSDTTAAVADREAASRLRSLGYLGGGVTSRPEKGRPDPKDRIVVASLLAQVTSGEVRGDERIATLKKILEADPANPQAHLRLGFAELERNRCERAEPHFRAAIEARLPSADAGLGLAQCRGRASDLDGAAAALAAADVLEPGNPVVHANLGLLAFSRDDAATAVKWLQAALDRDPSLLEARFALARALGRLGRRDEAAQQARDLLTRLPAGAPQRAEVQRLLDALK